jgi:hypothetical protein
MAIATLPPPTYRDDLYAWALDQAARLRAQAALRPNEPIDWDNLAEEIEGLARSELRGLKSQARRTIDHLLKLQHSHREEARRGWRLSILDARAELADGLTASLRRELASALDELYARQREQTVGTLLDYGEPDAAAAVPTTCPYSLEQILDLAWLPPPPAQRG